MKKCRVVCPPRFEEAQLPLGAGISNGQLWRNMVSVSNV